MSTQVTVTMANGTTLQAVNHRMSPFSPPVPSVPASPYPFTGGVYHLLTASGWVDLPMSQVARITVAPGATT